MSVGGLSVGGLSVGGLSVGGLSVGGLSVGGLSVGGLSLSVLDERPRGMTMVREKEGRQPGATADLESWDVRLLSSTSEAGAAPGAARIKHTGTTKHRTSGRELVICDTVCNSRRDADGRCVGWEERETSTKISGWDVSVVTGELCWANDEIVTPETSWIRVRLIDPANPGGKAWQGSGFPNAGGLPAINFEWEHAD